MGIVRNLGTRLSSHARAAFRPETKITTLEFERMRLVDYSYDGRYMGTKEHLCTTWIQAVETGEKGSYYIETKEHYRDDSLNGEDKDRNYKDRSSPKIQLVPKNSILAFLQCAETSMKKKYYIASSQPHAPLHFSKHIEQLSSSDREQLNKDALSLEKYSGLDKL